MLVNAEIANLTLRLRQILDPANVSVGGYPDAQYRYCHESNWSVVIQGGLTGLAGGAYPSDGATRATPLQLCRASQWCAEVGIAIDAAGAQLLYLPPYSPDLNPIEMAFAKLKAALRKAAVRSIEALDNAIALALAGFTAQECLNFFAAAGYDRV